MGIKEEFKALLDEFESKIHGLFDKVKDSPELATAVDDAKGEVSGLVGDAKGQVGEIVKTAEADAGADAKMAEADATKSAGDATAVVETVAPPAASTPAADPAPGQAG